VIIGKLIPAGSGVEERTRLKERARMMLLGGEPEALPEIIEGEAAPAEDALSAVAPDVDDDE